jgi:uncharacterized repeat protein (TIGR03803 family)
VEPERWRRIEAVYHAALAIDPARRAVFLSESCAGDDVLRSEVEELLDFDARADGFIETPALQVLARQEARALEASSGFRLAAGAQLGPYQILKPLGAGGMGEIYSARDTRLGRTVAVKILTALMMDQAGFRERLEREARAVSNLNHPHICTLHDIGNHEGVDYLVMEFVEGQSLAERLKDGPLPASEVLRIAIQIAEALDYAHRQGVIHRDLKPGNIMLTARGAKLVDFGLARWRDADDPAAGTGGESRDPSRTQAGAVLGTPQYMAPEQIARGKVDARADIFALGAVIFEMASGEKALGEARSQAKIPAALKLVVDRCLRISPEERWQTAGDLITGLNRIETSTAARSGTYAWIAAGAIAILAAGVWVFRATHRPAAAVEQVVYSFTGQNGDGAKASASVMRAKNGRFYGATTRGGAFGKGAVYELKRPAAAGSQWAESVVYSFRGTGDGSDPISMLTEGPNGQLYGIAAIAGGSNQGAVFELMPPAVTDGNWTERVLHSFARQDGDGILPRPDLAIGRNGVLYSATLYGGIPLEDGRGTVFQLTPPASPGNAWEEKVLYRFSGANGDGSYPYSNVVPGPDGAIYGTTFNGSSGPGTIYKLSPPEDAEGNRDGHWTETILHQFTGTDGDGRSPVGDLAFGKGGALYGTTQWGGISGNGTVWELKPSQSAAGGWTYSVLHRFTSHIGDGAEPTSGILVGENGNLYGTTTKGGTWGNGTVYQMTLTRGAWSEAILHSFTGNDGDGGIPGCLGRLVFDRGALFGTTEAGGTSNAGTVFKVTLPNGR